MFRYCIVHINVFTHISIKSTDIIWCSESGSIQYVQILRTHGPEHSIFVTDTFILIPYALTWDSMMYHHCEKVPAALWVYHGVH